MVQQAGRAFWQLVVHFSAVSVPQPTGIHEQRVICEKETSGRIRVCLHNVRRFSRCEARAHVSVLRCRSQSLDISNTGVPKFYRRARSEGTKSLTVQEMTNRMSYLNDCGVAYPVLNKNRPGELSALFSLGLIYGSETKRRLSTFLDRHGLSGKFTEEDEAGKR